MERPIESLLDSYSIDDLQERIQSVAKQHPRILGVLAIGSLVQTETPADFYVPRHEGRAGQAYEQIRRPLRRKNGMCRDSDLDIWICTEDTLVSEAARPQVDKGGAALVEEIASGTLKKGSLHWRSKKLQAFGRYYKQNDLYHGEDKHPWLSEGFKSELEDIVSTTMPEFSQRINGHFSKHIPGDFLEVRAFPESLFNLRPDEATLPNGTEDRAPFPRIADDQWISTRHNAHVFYVKDGISIYPFVEDGEVLGSSIGAHIDNLAEMEKRKLSYGGIMLKPDAFRTEDLALIRKKIYDRIDHSGGRIVAQQSVDRLSDDDIDEIYPLLDRGEISDVRRYLQSGPVEIIIAELPHDPYETFRIINSIKGPRVGDRSIERLREGRVLDGGVRDLLPLPGDEHRYDRLISTILKKRKDPSVRFSDEDYDYYVQNLVHTPDNSIELNGLKSAICSQETAYERSEN